MQDKYTIMLPKLHLNQRSLVRVSVYALMGCIAILILLRDLGGIGISRFVFIGLAALACILSNKAGIYCIIAFLTPLATGISCTYITAIALVILLFKQKKLYTQPIGLACMVGILVLELLSAFRGLFSLMDYLRFVGIFVFSFLRTFDTQDDYNNDGIVHGYILGFWVSMTSVWGQMLQSYSFSELLKLGVRFGNTRLVLDLSTEGMLISYNTN
ncbi:MAG: hypothetical protein RR797_04520, partial [Christensenella sp.]